MTNELRRILAFDERLLAEAVMGYDSIIGQMYEVLTERIKPGHSSWEQFNNWKHEAQRYRSIEDCKRFWKRGQPNLFPLCLHFKQDYHSRSQLKHNRRKAKRLDAFDAILRVVNGKLQVQPGDPIKLPAKPAPIFTIINGAEHPQLTGLKKTYGDFTHAWLWGCCDGLPYRRSVIYFLVRLREEVIIQRCQKNNLRIPYSHDLERLAFQDLHHYFWRCFHVPLLDADRTRALTLFREASGDRNAQLYRLRH